jgi:thiamine biosynthesis protein ThiI
MNHYLLRYGEIALKGKNRRVFEIILKSNILNYVKNRYNENAKMFVIRGRFVLTTEADVDLRPIFGLTSYSKAVKVEKDIELIKEKAIEEFAKINSPENFKVVSHRLDKSFPIKTPEINRIVGEVIYEKFKVPAKMKSPKTVLGIEIHNNTAFVYVETVKCFAGLPLGSSGKVLVPLTNNRSILTALNLMRRGCKVTFIGDKKDIPLIKLYSNYQNPIFIKNKEDSEIIAYALPNKIDKLDKVEGFLLLYPIALLSDKEVEEELKKYEI